MADIPIDNGPVDEAPVDGPPTEDQTEVFDLAKLTIYVNDIVTVDKKISGIQVKEIYKAFGVTRTIDIKKEDVMKVKEAIDILVAQVS